jgi:hypothetical protein
MADLVSWLQLSGLDPADNADVIALFDDGCVWTILNDVPAMDCDPQFTDLLRNTARTIEHRNRHRHLPRPDQGA